MTLLISSSTFHSPVAAGCRSSHSCGGHGAWLNNVQKRPEYNLLWDMTRTLMLKGIRQTKQMPLRPQPCISLVANYLPPLRDAIPHPSVLLHTPSSTKIKAYHKSSLFWGDWADWTGRITSHHSCTSCGLLIVAVDYHPPIIRTEWILTLATQP